MQKLLQSLSIITLAFLFSYGTVRGASYLFVPQGGTGVTTIPVNTLMVGNGTGAITSTSSPTVGYITATSTTATSTFMGKVGIGTTTPSFLLDTYSTGTTTMRIDSSSADKGSCLVMKDRDGVGYTYITANDGVLTASTNPCN